jgi:hypothetical protein
LLEVKTFAPPRSTNGGAKREHAVSLSRALHTHDLRSNHPTNEDLFAGTSSHHPTNEDLFAGTPSHHPTNEDLFAGTPSHWVILKITLTVVSTSTGWPFNR